MISVSTVGKKRNKKFSCSLFFLSLSSKLVFLRPDYDFRFSVALAENEKLQSENLIYLAFCSVPWDELWADEYKRRILESIKPSYILTYFIL